MLSVRIGNDLEKRLGELGEKTGRSKSYYVRKAVQEYLDEREDVMLALIGEINCNYLVFPI